MLFTKPIRLLKNIKEQKFFKMGVHINQNLISDSIRIHNCGLKKIVYTAPNVIKINVKFFNVFGP